MTQAEPRYVVDASGKAAAIVGRFREAPSGQERLLVELDSGERYAFPLDLLYVQNDGEYHLRQSFTQLQGAAQQITRERQMVPLVSEQLSVGKRAFDTTVRLTKSVQEHTEEVTVPLLQEEVEIRRVPVNKPLSRPAKTRQEGDTLIVPVMEEVVEVTKRLMLREEVHVTRREQRREHREQITLRSEQLNVERRNEEGTSSEEGPATR